MSCKRVSRSCIRARARLKVTAVLVRLLSHARAGVYGREHSINTHTQMQQVHVWSGPRTIREPVQPLTGASRTRHRDLDHPSPTCQSAAAALTNMDNLRAEGMNQTLRRGANITRPGCSCYSGHWRANMSGLLHAGYGRKSVRARCCAGWQHSSCDARAHAGSTRTAASHRVAPCIGAPAREMCCGPRSARAPAALRRLWRASMWGSMVRVLRFTGRCDRGGVL